MTDFWEIQRALDGPHGDNASLYARTAELIAAANFPDDSVFAERTVTRFIDRCKELRVPIPSIDILDMMLRLSRGSYAGEMFTELPPNPALYDHHGEHALTGQMRDILLRQQRRAIEPTATLNALSDALASGFLALARRLPPAARYIENQDAEALTIPLIDLLSDVDSIIDEMIEPFSNAGAQSFDLFRYFRLPLAENVEKIKAAKKTKLSPRELVKSRLENTYIDELLLETQVPFAIPDEQRFSGHWIIAPSGRGKTTLLHSMFLEDLKKDAAIVLIDSKGDLIGPIKELAAIKDRLVLIEPDAESAFALNPFDTSNSNALQAVSLVEYVMAGLLDAKFTALQSTLFRNVVPAIIEGVAEPTIETFKQVMTKGLPGDALGKLNPHAAAFFTNRETGFWSKTYESTRREVVWRLDYLMTNPVLRAMFSAVHTKLDISKEMDAGKIIVINNSKAALTDEGAEFFGRFFIALIVRAAQQRAGRRPEDKKPCYVYIDECHTVVSKDTRVPTILDECRSQKIALILAHQRTAQLSDPVLDAAANSAIRMANSDDEAKYLADKLRMDVDEIRALPRGTFGTFVRDMTSKGVALKVPYVDLSTLPKMTASDQVEIREKMRDLYSSPPVALLAQVVVLADEPPAVVVAPPAEKPSFDGDDHTKPATSW